MELFEEIRREYEHGVGSIRGIARKLGVHRRMVREAIVNAVPGERKRPVREKLSFKRLATTHNGFNQENAEYVSALRPPARNLGIEGRVGEEAHYTRDGCRCTALSAPENRECRNTS